MRIPHILHTLPNLLFFEVLKKKMDLIWLGYCLNRFIILKECGIDARKNQNRKILKSEQGYKE